MGKRSDFRRVKNEYYRTFDPRACAPLGPLLTNEMQRRNLSFRKVAKAVGLDQRTERTVAGGGTCSRATGRKIRIFLDLNPFELLDGVSQEMAGSPFSEMAE